MELGAEIGLVICHLLRHVRYSSVVRCYSSIGVMCKVGVGISIRVVSRYGNEAV